MNHVLYGGLDPHGKGQYWGVSGPLKTKHHNSLYQGTYGYTKADQLVKQRAVFKTMNSVWSSYKPSKEKMCVNFVSKYHRTTAMQKSVSAVAQQSRDVRCWPHQCCLLVSQFEYMPDWTERRTDTKPMLCGKALCEYVRHRTVGEIVRQCVHVAGNHLGVESFDCERLNGERQVAGQHREHVDAAVQDNTTVSMLTTPFSRHSKTCNHICRKSSLYRLLRPVHFTIMLVVECLHGTRI